MIGRDLKSVFITGASSGIGRACALHLDRMGYRVFAGVRNDPDRESLLQEASTRLEPILIDVTDERQIRAAQNLLGEALADVGLNGLVNNAGIAIGGPLEFMSLEDIRRQFEVNVIGQIAVTQAVLQLLRRGKGRIVNMSSVGGKFASPFIGPYVASKFALEAITDSLRRELLPWNIHVCSVEPGRIATPMWEKALEAAVIRMDQLPPQAKELYGALLPRLQDRYKGSGKTGIPPQEVAEVVELALSAAKPKTRYVIGRSAKIRIFLTRIMSDQFFDERVRQALYS